MKKLYCYTFMLYWITTQVSCEKCTDADALEIKDSAKLTCSSTSQTVVFFNVTVYTLNKTPLVQFVLLGTEDTVVAVRLRKPYSKNPGNWETDYGLLEFGYFEKTPDNEDKVLGFSDAYGTSRTKAKKEIAERCELLVLRDCFEKIVGCLMTAGIAIICYIVYAIFNFVVNYSTLIKAGRQSVMSIFYALSQSLTGRKIFKHQRQEIEKVHYALYTKMTEQEEKMKTLEEALRCYILLVQNRKLSECTYDYIQFPEIKKFAENLGENLENAVRNSQKSGYLTPIYFKK